MVDGWVVIRVVLVWLGLMRRGPVGPGWVMGLNWHEVPGRHHATTIKKRQLLVIIW